MISVLIVDDEPLSREGLRLLLADHQDMDVIGECANGNDAVKAILQLKPSLVFLDMQMPGLDGLGVVRAIGADDMPTVIFVTAYDEFAVDAFAVHAVDYLLKPVKEERFLKALSRAREKLLSDGLRQNSQRLGELLKAFQPNSQGSNPKEFAERDGRVVVRSHGHVYFLQPQDIVWIEASGDYVTIHAGAKSHLLRETMRNMEKRLQGKGFRRIHRSAIVNLECIRELQTSDTTDYKVVLTDGTEVNLGRSYRDALYSALGALE